MAFNFVGLLWVFVLFISMNGCFVLDCCLVCCLEFLLVLWVLAFVLCFLWIACGFSVVFVHVFNWVGVCYYGVLICLGCIVQGRLCCNFGI